MALDAEECVPGDRGEDRAQTGGGGRLSHFSWLRVELALRAQLQSRRHNIASVENDSLVVIRQYSMHQVKAYGPGQNDLFQIAALADEVLHRITMADSDNFLFNDRAIVQFRSHIMTGGPDQLDASLVGLVVGLGAHEGGGKE